MANPSIVVVANRGPNDFVWEDGQWITRTASGGLVSMLAPLALEPGVVWFCCVSEPPDATQARQGLFTTAADQTDQRLNVVPVPMPAGVYHAYYGQISNEVLWMLQHHIVGNGGFEYVDHARHVAWDAGYLEANQRLARAIGQQVEEPGAFLIQDYHLYPLPAMLREQYPDTPILHFTHIPFPEPPVLKLIPRTWREGILNGLLASDIVGLQTHWDVQAFLACCAELLGLKVNFDEGSVETRDGRTVRIRAYPASVDPKAIVETMLRDDVEAARQRLAPQMEHQTIIRVDRLDPSKNQLIGFLAFERLLDTRPDLRANLRFLAFLVPSRTDLGIYRAYRDLIYAKIEEINERYAAECGGEPIVLFYTNDQGQALAAMEGCDVLLINSLEDGMNLVAKEWAVVSKRPGALIVSETAGVAMEAEGAALLVSPLDVEGTAQAMATALEMSTSERSERLETFKQRVCDWTAQHWLEAQMADLGVAHATRSQVGATQ